MCFAKSTDENHTWKTGSSIVFFFLSVYKCISRTKQGAVATNLPKA